MAKEVYVVDQGKMAKIIKECSKERGWQLKHVDSHHFRRQNETWELTIAEERVSEHREEYDSGSDPLSAK